jgi:tRNA(Ile)-lysidine synthase
MRYNKSVINRVIFAVIKKLKGCLAGYESKHIDLVLGLKCKTSGKTIQLPKHLYAQKIYDRIVMGTAVASRSFKIRVGLTGSVQVAGGMVLRTSIVKFFDRGSKRGQCEFFDLSAIKPPLYARNRREGDVILTISGRKKIKKLLNEKKIPAFERDGMVMLCDQKGIMWMPGVGRACRGFVKKGARKILKVEFEHIDQRR